MATITVSIRHVDDPYNEMASTDIEASACKYGRLLVLKNSTTDYDPYAIVAFVIGVDTGTNTPYYTLFVKDHSPGFGNFTGDFPPPPGDELSIE